jgi:hypothetical protein
MRTTIGAAMLALLVGGSLAATATDFGPSSEAARPQPHTDKHGTLYAMRPSDPRFRST